MKNNDALHKFGLAVCERISAKRTVATVVILYALWLGFFIFRFVTSKIDDYEFFRLSFMTTFAAIIAAHRSFITVFKAINTACLQADAFTGGDMRISDSLAEAEEAFKTKYALVYNKAQSREIAHIRKKVLRIERKADMREAMEGRKEDEHDG